MKALILVGGFGTRLRPLTWTIPKPLVPFANKPMVLQQVEALLKVGVTEVILAVNYNSELFTNQLTQWEQKYGIKFISSQETEPMGTGGPLALAREKLKSLGEEPFFVFNSDVICAFQEKQILEKMIAFHKNHGKQGTMLVTKVTDPSKYGVVISQQDGEITRFVEKPQTWVGDRINAGIYLFNPSMLSRIELRPTSIEKEIFPAMAADKQLYAMTLEGFWMDIGQPKDYLIGMCLFLNFSKTYESTRIPAQAFKNAPRFVGNVLIHPNAQFGTNCVIGPNVIIGENVRIGNDVHMNRVTLMDNVTVGDSSRLVSCIIGFNCVLGNNSAVGLSVLGENLKVAANSLILEAKIPIQSEKDQKDFHTTPLPSRHPTYNDFLDTVRKELLIALPTDSKDRVNAVIAYIIACISEVDYPLSLVTAIRNNQSLE